MLRSTITILCLAIGVQCMSNDVLLDIIDKACPAGDLFCPKGDYGIFLGFHWVWNTDVIVASEFAREFRKGRHATMQLLMDLRNEFCCVDGPCLHRCGVVKKREIDLVQDFPMNAQDILDLNLPELEEHRDFITNWLKTHRTDVFPAGRIPAALESYFDDLVRFQVLVRARLHQKGLWLR